VFVAVLVGLDIGARAYAERRAGDILQTSLGASERPAVSLGGWPFMLGVAKGEVDSLDVTAHDAIVDKVDLEALSVTMNHVTVSVSELMSGTGTIKAEDGSGTAELTAAAVTKALRDAGVKVTVAFRDGATLITPDDTNSTLEATVSVSNDTLVVRPAAGAAPSMSMALPQLIDGMTFTNVDVRGKVAFLTFDLDHPQFEV
jgi:hypothetical protein